MSDRAQPPAGAARSEVGTPPPDVVGYPLEEALRVVEAAGWQVTVRTTAPPRSTPAGGLQRVVRQRATSPGQLELVAAWERYTLLRRPFRTREPSEPA
ncbi:hypothetical protein HRbin32_01618 [bacterium HR32]|nr:hypothetical protein HRbin32_01618 [bacterium HR32]